MNFSQKLYFSVNLNIRFCISQECFYRIPYPKSMQKTSCYPRPSDAAWNSASLRTWYKSLRCYFSARKDHYVGSLSFLHQCLSSFLFPPHNLRRVSVTLFFFSSFLTQCAPISFRGPRFLFTGPVPT